MAIGDIRCTECGGTGRVLKHFYNQNYANTLGNAGSGMVNCPRCYGRGTVQGTVPDKSNNEEAASNDNTSFTHKSVIKSTNEELHAHS